MKLLKIHLHLSDKRCERFTEMLGHFLLTDLKFWSHHKNVWFHKSRVEAKNLGAFAQTLQILAATQKSVHYVDLQKLTLPLHFFFTAAKMFFFVRNQYYKEEFLVLHYNIWMNSVFKNLLLFNWLSILLRNHSGLSPINQIEFIAIYKTRCMVI